MSEGRLIAHSYNIALVLYSILYILGVIHHQRPTWQEEKLNFLDIACITLQSRYSVEEIGPIFWYIYLHIIVFGHCHKI